VFDLTVDGNRVEEVPYIVGAPNTAEIRLLFDCFEIRRHQEDSRARLSKGSEQGIVLELAGNDGVDSLRFQP